MTTQEICAALLEKAEHIRTALDSMEYERNVQLSSLMSTLERLGVPLFMDEAVEWAHRSEEHQIMLETYQAIADMRTL